MNDRPYFNTSTSELINEARRCWFNKQRLLAILNELSFRRRRNAVLLADEIKKRLATLTEDASEPSDSKTSQAAKHATRILNHKDNEQPVSTYEQRFAKQLFDE